MTARRAMREPPDGRPEAVSVPAGSPSRWQELAAWEIIRGLPEDEPRIIFPWRPAPASVGWF